MPQLTTPEELFVHELQDMYYAEQTLTKVLPKLANESTDRELSKAFTNHLAETKEQIENLGLGLSRLEEAMEELKSRYDLTTADLNIDLGPLGTLLSDNF